jgi:CBS domain-containing protein
MPFPVINLIENQGNILTTKKEELVSVAFSKMIEHDFSQLPVVDEEERPYGMITYESILRGIRHFNTSLDELHVHDVMIDAPTFNLEDDIFDLLDRLKNTNAVLILDPGYCLYGIVTSYDTTEFFRSRTEDLMHVEDIEMMIKDFIKLSHANSADEVDEKKLATTVKKECFSNGMNDSTKTFDQLSLGNYIHLLLCSEVWDIIEPIMNIPRESLFTLLDNVRKTRNDLAHFRNEITSDQQDGLIFCADWMSQRQEEWDSIRQRAKFAKLNKVQEPAEIYPLQNQKIDISNNSTSNASFQININDQNDSRYAPLADFLLSKSGEIDQIKISFDEIEVIIGGALPISARSHRAWWANDTTGHSQSRNWLESGWRTSYVNMTEGSVVFVRIKEREKAYIDFFGAILSDLSAKAKIPIKKVSPDGTSWMVISSLPLIGPSGATFTYSFSRDKRFRIEVYLDTNDQMRNKTIFDLLAEKKQKYEGILGDLSWERIDKKRASRIAIYHAGQITDNNAKLTELRYWAVETMIVFYETFASDVEQILNKMTRA